MQLKDVVPWGRTLAEYEAMFSLSTEDKAKQILGCGDGPSSFNAAMGCSVVSVDPVYQFGVAEIRQRIEQTYEQVVSQVRENAERYVWRTFENADQMGRARLAGMEQFLNDFEQGKVAGRYVTGALPELRFEGQTFDLCLCSHLLFLYSEQLSEEFHLGSVAELLRVSREVRIFPLLDLKGDPSPHLDPVLKYVNQNGILGNIELVDYEFQKGGNQMLRICH